PLRGVAVRRPVVPSREVTVPVGVPAPGATAATVAVKVTDCPNTVGFVADTTVALLLALLTVCGSVVEMLLEKLVSPPKATVIAWLATARAAVLKVAVPLASVAVPKVVVPSRKVAVPVGVPAPGVAALTVAVRGTDWPNTDGFSDAVRAMGVG